MSDRVLEEIAALKDEDWALREEAATLLGEFRDPRAVGPLVEALHDEDRAVREAATTALRKIGPPAAPALIVALQDPNGNVQEAAVAILKDVATPEALGKIGAEEAVVPLCDVMLHDRDMAVRQDAAKALGSIGHPAAFEALEKAVTDLSVRPYAVDALGKLKDPRAVPILIDVVAGKNRPANARRVPVCGDESGALDVEEMEVQIFAVGGLAEIGDDRAIQPLIRALKDTRLRAAAASALSKMGLRIAAPLLAAMRTETDSNILSPARGILSPVGWRPAPTVKEGV